VFIQKVAQLSRGSNQVDPYGKLTGRHDCALNLGFGSLIGTDCIKNDVDEHVQITVAAS